MRNEFTKARCRYCGRNEAVTRTTGTQWFVECFSCHARGAFVPATDMAIDAWNKHNAGATLPEELTDACKAKEKESAERAESCELKRAGWFVCEPNSKGRRVIFKVMAPTPHGCWACPLFGTQDITNKCAKSRELPFGYAPGPDCPYYYGGAL